MYAYKYNYTKSSGAPPKKEYKMDKEKLEQAARLILEAIGENPNREGLRETPRRFAEMMAEQMAMTEVTNDEIAKQFDKTFTSPENDVVIVKDIPLFSHCEHHLALMYHMTAAIGYIPKGKVIGLSKIARIAEAVSKRLQIQERIGSDIRDIIAKITGAEDIIVYIEGEHSCMTARGIKKPGSVTQTIASMGKYKSDGAMKSEFLGLIRK